MLKQKITKAVLFAALCTFGASGFLMGQSTTQGAIGGTVQDSTGAVVGKATIRIHNDATNAEQVLMSDDSGFYKAPLLEPGTYTVTVMAPGFGGYRANGVAGDAGSTERRFSKADGRVFGFHR